jgi:hypothetical protein
VHIFSEQCVFREFECNVVLLHGRTSSGWRPDGNCGRMVSMWSAILRQDGDEIQTFPSGG